MKDFLDKLFGKVPEETAEPDLDMPDLDDEDELDFTVSDDGPEDDNNTFINSLEMLSEEDVPLSSGAVQKKKTPMDIARTCVFYISAAVFVVSCVLLLKNFIDQQRGDAIYGELQDMFLGDGFDVTLSEMREDGDALLLNKDMGSSGLSSMTDALNKISAGESIEIPVQNQYNEELAKMRARLQSLGTINEDIYGWIHVDGTKQCAQITAAERARMIGQLKSLPMTVLSPRPIAEAIVTCGGVSTKEVAPATLMSKKVKGLFFAGEVLDVDAYTGGFNLQIAFSTGALAGSSAAAFDPDCT